MNHMHNNSFIGFIGVVGSMVRRNLSSDEVGLMEKGRAEAGAPNGQTPRELQEDPTAWRVSIQGEQLLNCVLLAYEAREIKESAKTAFSKLGVAGVGARQHFAWHPRRRPWPRACFSKRIDPQKASVLGDGIFFLCFFFFSLSLSISLW